MAKDSKTKMYAYLGLRLVLVSLFTAGFFYQTMEFMYLYWTYPTVVDIQESSPTYLEVPAFTFCNRIGYRFENICDKFSSGSCVPEKSAGEALKRIVCIQYPEVCDNGTYPKKFTVLLYQKFMTKTALTRDDIMLLATPLEEYLTCNIEFAGQTIQCDMDNVIGSFYATEDLPQFCYTIYSKWGNPNKTRTKIPKGAIMKFDLFLNLSRRTQPHETLETVHYPMEYNPPTDAAVQMAVHSPYFLPSPYFDGFALLGARSYELRVKLTENHLLPAPYQTNCTDYLATWLGRGGKAPINQLTTIQECRINKTYEELRCIPVSMDYPHPYGICKSCEDDELDCEWVEPDNDCTSLADRYNQPCDSVEYITDVQNKVITVFEHLDSPWADKSDGLRHTLIEHNCTGTKLFGPKCSTINITVPFDRFVIKNYTYIAKFESLEVFSVVGGYMGMWVGVSILTVFDVMSDGAVMLRAHFMKKKRRAARENRAKAQHMQKSSYEDKKLMETAYNAW